MSGRRPAEDQPAGQPPAKKPFDINSIRAQIAAKKAEVEAKLASRGGTGSGSASPAPRERERSPRRDSRRDRDSRGDDRYDRRDRRDDRDRDDRRDRDHRERRDSPRRSPPRDSAPAPGPAALPPKPTVNPEIAARIAAAKARIDALKSKQPTPSNPYVDKEKGREQDEAPRPRPVSSGVALHPLLMADAAASEEKNEKKAMSKRYKPMAPKFSTVRANAAAVEEAHKTMLKSQPAAAAATIVTNPYAPAPPAPPSVGPTVPGEEASTERIRERRSRKMHFSAPGKYVRQGDQLRSEIKLEELKQRIAEQSRKAGLDSEFDVLERSLKRAPPPEVEWWDEAILPQGSNYDNIAHAEEWFRTTNDSLITHLVQHPIPIPAPSERKQTVGGIMLTKKEQRKMRRQRRQADLEEKRDKQKMGLIPPDAPKVRLANLMKVLTSDAVQDPTKVEAKVKREVAMRQIRHEQDNEERKLTPEQRKEKEYQRMIAREQKGLFATAYLVRHLTNGRHIFKVRETAKHDMLSGLCIFHPNFALVIVEGVSKKIKHYKQLMTNRIDWTEEARARGGGSDASGSEDEDADKVKEEEKDAVKQEDGPDMSENQCEIIWEGEIPERTFRIFRARHAETDSAGKEFLTPKYEGIWDLAKRWTWQDEDL